ncbi:uncharacterized protein OCT59_005184 [Rhizophagus irregularis]|uniref:Uncharacterized protein n=1 Tax=Rhizophagus irregularis (strain DAOM 181602 / DAOM 197198 / MUCL 43194) TaxID=747089 RepID=U9UKW2_RHIID|nr:hypothetical protein OCT59_005184 [Rhizophagus irregularis]
MTFQEYLIGTCLSCKKCLYCGVEFSIQKKMCTCDKTIKPNITTTFKFSFCLACNSAFQRKKSNTNSKSSTPCKISLEFDSNRNSSEDDKPAQTRSNSIDLNESDDKDNDNIEITLPSKWMEIEVSSLDDILADIHLCVKKLTGNKNIMHPDYLVSFKSEKAIGAGTQLVDL